jgi:hypothetical protein
MLAALRQGKPVIVRRAQKAKSGFQFNATSEQVEAAIGRSTSDATVAVHSPHGDLADIGLPRLHELLQEGFHKFNCLQVF